jgi:hypothetical protein
MYRTRKPTNLDGLVAGALICLTLYCAGLTYDAIKNHDKNALIYGALAIMDAVPAYYFLRKSLSKE